jgi:N-acetyl-gamma-glutamylphosphate reductase
MSETNDIEIHVFAKQARRQALLIAKFDNLGKGRVRRGGAEP